MRRFLSFMLGLIFGIVFLLGTFGLAMYASVTVVHPNEIYTDIENYLGDLGDVSLLQAYYNILDLYQNKTGNLTNEKLYSVGDFLADNHISSTNEDGQTVAFGIVMPKELLDAPLFEYFNTNVDENGHTGVQRALIQIKLSSVPAIVNTFATPGEDGEPVISDAVVAELDNYSVFDLVYGEQTDDGEPDIIANLATVLENITLADLVPALRQETETDNLIKNLLLAVGKAPIGKLITELTGDENILGILGDDGSLSAVGKLTVVDILGDSDPLVSSLVGSVCVSDFINDQGEFSIMKALDNISIAGLFSVVKRPVDVEIANENITAYYETKADDSHGPLIWSVGTVSGKYYISLDAENDCIATTWYEGQLVCVDSHDTHEASCFDYLWYMPCEVDHDHADEYTIGVNEVATAYAPITTTSLFYTIANIKLSCLFDDTGAINIDNLISQFDDHSLDTIIKEVLANNEVLDKVSELLELDGVTLSQLLADGGIDTLLSNVTDMPIAHILEVFEVTEMDIVVDLVGDMSINQLVEGGFTDISIGGLLGLVKREMDITDTNGDLLEGVTVRDFTNTIEGETVVELSVAKHVVDAYTLYYLSTDYNKDADKLAEDYVAPTWYEGQLDCSNQEHGTFDSHERDCFEYVLYQACANEEVTHDHATEDAFFITKTQSEVDIVTYYVETNKLYSVLGNMTVGTIIEAGFNTLFDELLDLKLCELFDILGLGETEGIMNTLSKFSIKELIEGGYNSLTLGDLLGYKRYQNYGAIISGSTTTFKDTLNNVVGHVAKVGEQTVLSTEGETWYNGKLTCNEDHTHQFDCYEYLWYTACPDSCVEEHGHVTIDGKPHTSAKGIFGALVDTTIGDITDNPNSLMDKVLEVKIGELLDEELEGFMASLADYSIKDLMDPSTLDNIGIDGILSYVRKDITNYVTTANGWVVDVVIDGENTIVKQNSTTGEYAYFDVDNGKWYVGQMHCKKNEHTHTVPDCGTADSWTTCDKNQHIHDVDCYGYVWYEKCEKTSCADHKDHFTTDGTTYGSVSGLYGVLADLTIGDLTGGADIMDTLTSRLTLGDIFGENMPEMLKSLKDTPIAELSGAIETTKVGDLLGYEYNEDESQWEKNIDGTMQPLDGVEKVVADKTISDLKDFNSILDEVTLGDVLDPIPEMLGTLANVKIPDLAKELETLKVGNLLGYEYNESKSQWEKEVDGTMQPLDGVEKIIAGKTINDLKDFNSILDEVTLGDVLDPVPDMLAKLKDKSITSLGEEIDTLVVGDFLGYGYLSVNVTNTNWTEVEGITGLFKHTDETFAKVDNNGTKHYVAELTCHDDLHTHVEPDCGTANAWTCEQTEHSHTANCYNYKWYSKCDNGCTGSTHEGDKHYEDINGDYFVAVVGITSKLANKTINELSNLTDLMNDLTLNDVFGEGKVPGILQSIADENIANLEKALNTIYVGDFLGYEQGNVLLVCTETNPAHIHNEDLGDTNCCYQKKLACNDTAHTHSAMCYIKCYEWWQLACSDNNHQHDFATSTECYAKLGGIMGKIANERLDTLSDMGETIKTFTLRDVLGNDIPDMLKGIADTPIGDLDDALDNLYLGEILEYTKHQADDTTVADCTTTVVDGVVRTNAGKTAYIMLVDGVWYDAVVSCSDTSCGHNLADCYGYLWYEKCETVDCATHTNHVTIDGELYCKATGITAKLANERVSELGSLGDTIQSYSLYDVLGDNVPSMLEGIKYEPINNLDSSINNIYVGEFLGYTKNGVNGSQTLDCQTDGHTSTDHTSECYYDNYNWTDNGTVVDGMMSKIANKKVGNLGTIGDDIETFTFAEIMGRNDGDNAIIKELYDTPVGDVGSKMNTMMLGTAMGYYRKVICGENHSHVDACYETVDGKVVWYTDADAEIKVTAPQSAFVNSTLENVGDDISNIKLGELIEINDSSSSMLQALQDTPINGIATAIDSMALGTSMGFVRREMDDASYTTTVVADAVKTDGTNFVKKHDGVWCEATTSCQESHTHTADCFDYVWYEECKLDEHTHSTSCAQSCEIEEHSHTTDVVIDGALHKKVTGLNAKMSNLTVGNMGGQAVVDIVTGLSMRDMMDSGILNFTEEEKFKLAILFGCDNDEHKVTYMFTDFQCDLKGYFAYNATMTSPSQPTLTTEQFYKKTHTIADGEALTTEQLAHRDIWQDCTLTEFIEALLAGF